MAFDPNSVIAELNTIVNEAVSYDDLVEKLAPTIANFANLIPGAGPEVAKLLPILQTINTGLHDLQSALANL